MVKFRDSSTSRAPRVLLIAVFAVLMLPMPTYADHGNCGQAFFYLGAFRGDLSTIGIRAQIENDEPAVCYEQGTDAYAYVGNNGTTPRKYVLGV